ncbi:MAG: hypothetical protein U9N48_09390 [Euryarchaeota archaeon]|nr:hypothetical protein [Euryarchaeota archaeon]
MSPVILMQDEATIDEGYYDLLARLGVPYLYWGGMQATERLASLCRIDATKRVLVVGCGTGYSACHISEADAESLGSTSPGYGRAGRREGRGAESIGPGGVPRCRCPRPCPSVSSSYSSLSGQRWRGARLAPGDGALDRVAGA